MQQQLQTREAHRDLRIAHQEESARFCAKWGDQGNFDAQAAQDLLQASETFFSRAHRHAELTLLWCRQLSCTLTRWCTSWASIRPGAWTRRSG